MHLVDRNGTTRAPVDRTEQVSASGERPVFVRTLTESLMRLVTGP